MSDTPRTDAAFSAKRTFPAGIVELQDFARQLERERNAWRSCAEHLKDAVCTALNCGSQQGFEREFCKEALAEFERLKGKSL